MSNRIYLKSGHLYNNMHIDIYQKDLMNNIYLPQLNFGVFADITFS
jgi:hypothetical protein